MMAYYYRNGFATKIGTLFIGVFFIVLTCEYFIYYIVQMKCGWPNISEDGSDHKPVRAMILADTHLLGSVKGHWLDKLRREWQMQRAFQAAITLHNPEVVFILGDLFDEGLWCPQKEFQDYVARFNDMFKVPNGTQLYTVIGNHDVGFHYRMTPFLVRRFEKQLNSPSVQVVSIKDNHFVLINSVAMEGDGCILCSEAVKKLDEISNLLSCSNGSSLCKGTQKLPGKYSRPIIMQHFPLYRTSDSACTEDDAAPPSERSKPFVERWDCLSWESTSHLITKLKPRAAFGGHTHHGCRVEHDTHGVRFFEFSVPSFSCRNRRDPKYMLVSVTPDEYKVVKCAMPTEFQVILLYMILSFILSIILLKRRRLKC